MRCPFCADSSDRVVDYRERRDCDCVRYKLAYVRFAPFHREFEEINRTIEGKA